MSNRICFLANGLKRNDPRIFWRKARSLYKEGYEVTIIASDCKKNEIVEGIKIIPSGFTSLNRWQRILSSKKCFLLRALEIDADIYQISEPELISVGIQLLKQKKIVVYDMRENYPSLIYTKDYLPKVIRPLVSFALEIYMSKSLKKFNAVFAVTPHIVDYIKLRWKCKDVYLVTNYPIVDYHYKLSFEEYSARKNILCYIGSVYRISRQEITFEALENIPILQYIIAGKIPLDYEVELKELPYWNKVEFIDGISKSELSKLYQRFTIGNSLRDFTVTGDKKGSLGVIKIFEYMEAALPIICSNVELWKNIIEKYNCGICVDPNNSDEIYKALLFMIENKEKSYLMGQNGRKAVLEEYNWNSQAAEYINVISRLLAFNK
jgi:glycosyltransferase involved in cell wall biosynthesis